MHKASRVFILSMVSGVLSVLAAVIYSSSYKLGFSSFLIIHICIVSIYRYIATAYAVVEISFIIRRYWITEYYDIYFLHFHGYFPN